MSWPTVPIAEACEIVSGATPDTNEPSFWGGDICWATPKDLSDLDGAMISDTPRKLTKAGLASCSSNLLPVGSVLFSSRAPIGHVAVNTVPMATNQGFKSFVPKAGKLDAKFLYYWLRAHRPQLEAMGNGATFKEVSKAVVERVRIPLPPLAEQKRIAAVLDKADDLRGKRRQALATLDTLLQSVFLDMFGDQVTNPKGWPVVTLGEISTKITDGVHLKPNYMPSGVPFISVKDVSSGRLFFEKCKYVSQEDHDKMFSRCNPERGDILYTKVGTYGIPVIVDSDREFSLYVSVALVKPERSRVDSMFLREAMAGYGIRRQAVKAIKGIGVPDLHLVEIRKFRLPLPPLTKQQEFCRRCDSAIRMRDRLIANQEQLDALFAALQSAAFAGTLFNGEMVKAAASEPSHPTARRKEVEAT